jgi:diguanylate cyclase (GGDEF)-like protein/PAS domain S-box-containing protein
VRQLQGGARTIVGAVLISLTVCTLHFTSMAGLVLVPDPTVSSQRLLVIDRAALAAVVAVASSAIVLFGSAAAVVDRLLTDVRGLADASLEGLFILYQDKICEVNEMATVLTGLARGDLIGLKIDELVVPTSDHALMHGAAIGALSPLTGRKAEVEMFVRDIEYRGRPCSVAVLRDITERRRTERVISHMARHDPLTDLLNRREFDRNLNALCSAPDKSLALLCLDLDNFKLVNDIGGHAAGDEILRKVAAILRQSSCGGDLAFRLGGDEFAILETGKAQPTSSLVLAEQVLKEIQTLSTSLGFSYFGSSIGIAVLPVNPIEGEALHSRADSALYAAKEAGRGQVKVFDNTGTTNESIGLSLPKIRGLPETEINV